MFGNSGLDLNQLKNDCFQRNDVNVSFARKIYKQALTGSDESRDVMGQILSTSC